MDVESSSLLNGLNVDDEWKCIEALKNGNDLSGAKIQGSYAYYLNMMVKNHQSCSSKREGEIIVLDSYGGAEHSYNTRKRKILFHIAPRCLGHEQLMMGHQQVKHATF